MSTGSEGGHVFIPVARMLQHVQRSKERREGVREDTRDEREEIEKIEI
jgi:hypothetical protein